MKTGRELVRRSFIHHVTHEHDFEDDFLFYRFLGEDSRRSLNAKLTHKCSQRPGKGPLRGTGAHTHTHACMIVSSLCLCPAIEIATEMRKKILQLYGEHLSPDGHVRSTCTQCVCDLV